MSIPQEPIESEVPQARSITASPFLWIQAEAVDHCLNMFGLEGLGVYTALAHYTNNATGQCWPSIARLSRDVAAKPRVIRQYLKALEAIGLILISPHERYEYVFTLLTAPSDLPDLREQLRALPYECYLLTTHWQQIRRNALRQAKDRCQLCNTGRRLHVHHRSYEHRGEEQQYMEDVIVLCARCHAKHHGIPSMPGETASVGESTGESN